MSDLPTFRVPKQTACRVFKSIIAKHFNRPESRIRLWVLVNRQNRTVRPDEYIPENEPSLSMSFGSHANNFRRYSLAVEAIRNKMDARQSILRLYLDILPDPPKVYRFISNLVPLMHEENTVGHRWNGHGLPQAF